MGNPWNGPNDCTVLMGHQSIGFTWSGYVDRINLKMEYSVAAKIVALRPAMEAMIVRTTTNPEGVGSPSAQEEALMSAVRGLSKPRAGKHGIQDDMG